MYLFYGCLSLSVSPPGVGLKEAGGEALPAISEMLERIAALTSKVALVETRLAVVKDPRFFMLGGFLKSLNGKHSEASAFHRTHFPGCVFCGAETNLTMAHLISEFNPVQAQELGLRVDVFGPPTYVDDINPKSARNFLRLCGTKGERGTCHDLFDNYEIGLLYDPSDQHFEIRCVDEKKNKERGFRLKFIGFFTIDRDEFFEII